MLVCPSKTLLFGCLAKVPTNADSNTYRRRVSTLLIGAQEYEGGTE